LIIFSLKISFQVFISKIPNKSWKGVEVALKKMLSTEGFEQTQR